MCLAFVGSPRWRHSKLRPAWPHGGSAARPSLPHRAAASRPAIRPPRHPPFGGPRAESAPAAGTGRRRGRHPRRRGRGQGRGRGRGHPGGAAAGRDITQRVTVLQSLRRRASRPYRRHTAWLPQPCRQSCMNESTMQYGWAARVRWARDQGSRKDSDSAGVPRVRPEWAPRPGPRSTQAQPRRAPTTRTRHPRHVSQHGNPRKRGQHGWSEEARAARRSDEVVGCGTEAQEPLKSPAIASHLTFQAYA